MFPLSFPYPGNEETSKYTLPGSATYACPGRSSVWVSSIISGMCSVAFGYSSAGRMPTAAASSNTASAYFSAVSSAGKPSSSTASSILSTASSEASSVMCPTSVMFMICVTR